MSTPLRRAREKRNLTIQKVAEAVGIDSGNLSRIERGNQTPSKKLTEKLVAFFDNEVTEVQILFPERFADADEVGQAPHSPTSATTHRGRSLVTRSPVDRRKHERRRADGRDAQ